MLLTLFTLHIQQLCYQATHKLYNENLCISFYYLYFRFLEGFRAVFLKGANIKTIEWHPDSLHCIMHASLISPFLSTAYIVCSITQTPKPLASLSYQHLFIYSYIQTWLRNQKKIFTHALSIQTYRGRAEMSENPQVNSTKMTSMTSFIRKQ